MQATEMHGFCYFFGPFYAYKMGTIFLSTDTAGNHNHQNYMSKKMMRLFQNSSRLIIMTLIIGMMAVGSGCKSKKKAMAAAAAEKARIEQEAELRRQQEEDARREAEERARREAEAKARAEAAAPQKKLEQLFGQIAGASDVASANRSITEALMLFASDNTPVLIVISDSGGIKDYDRPTTIKQYLEYLKDTRNNANAISNLQFDSSGKITEVELKK